MAGTDHYNFWSVDPDEEISDFPNTWNYNVDKIDAAIHEAATDNVTVARIPNLPASKTTSGTFDASRIPGLSASKTTSGTFADARMPDSIARTSDLDDETAALSDRLDGHGDRIDATETDLKNLDKRVDTTETDIEDHSKRLDDLEDNQNGGAGGSEHRQEDVEPEIGQGLISIERQGPLVFIWGSFSVDEDISPNTTLFKIPEWAQTDGICLMPCTSGDSSANLQVSGPNAIATTSLSEDARIYGSITYLTTNDIGDDNE